jgi:hypothetical protein
MAKDEPYYEKQDENIEVYKEEDKKLIRKKCLAILDSDELLTSATGAKAMMEAGKLLGRLQQSLQIDKQVVKQQADRARKEKRPPTSPEHQQFLDDIHKQDKA